MTFLPASCERCGDIRLMAASSFVDGEAPCVACGKRVVALTGPAVPEGDVRLFIAVCEAVEESAFSSPEAAELALDLSEPPTSTEERPMLELATSWFPRVAPLRSELEADLARARLVFSMVGLIFAERGAAPVHYSAGA